MHTCQAPTLVNIMMRNETWLHNLTMFICYASWTYGKNIKGFCAHAKAKCLEKSIIVFKFVDILTLLPKKMTFAPKKLFKKIKIRHYLFFSIQF
jgi:hypothetical protein